jgi:hypothetical protein
MCSGFWMGGWWVEVESGKERCGIFEHCVGEGFVMINLPSCC